MARDLAGGKGESFVAHRITKLEFVPQGGTMVVNALGKTARGTRIRIGTVSFSLYDKSPEELKRAKSEAISTLLGSPK